MLKVIVKQGRTALHLACNREAALVGRYPVCQFPLPQLVKALLLVGADPDTKDDDGNSPLHLAALARPCPASLAQALVEHGAHLVRFFFLKKNFFFKSLKHIQNFISH
jgi:ankyrin repeat protein